MVDSATAGPRSGVARRRAAELIARGGGEVYVWPHRLTGDDTKAMRGLALHGMEGNPPPAMLILARALLRLVNHVELRDGEDMMPPMPVTTRKWKLPE